MFHVYDPLSRSSVDMVGRLAWLPFGRNPFLYSSDAIRAPGTSLANSAYLIRDECDLDHIQKFFPLERALHKNSRFSVKRQSFRSGKNSSPGAPRRRSEPL